MSELTRRQMCQAVVLGVGGLLLPAASNSGGARCLMDRIFYALELYGTEAHEGWLWALKVHNAIGSLHFVMASACSDAPTAVEQTAWAAAEKLGSVWSRAKGAIVVVSTADLHRSYKAASAARREVGLRLDGGYRLQGIDEDRPRQGAV